MYGATQKRHRRGSPFWTRWSRGPKWTRAGWVDWSSGRRRARAGDGSPDSREAEGEGDDDFYIARSGKRADLLVSQGRGVVGLRIIEAGKPVFCGKPRVCYVFVLGTRQYLHTYNSKITTRALSARVFRVSEPRILACRRM
jgi:hypothetical protein